jgi:3-oxoacid CoA-transferase subunit A
MIQHVIITGDTHGRPIERIHKICEIYPHYKPEETIVIILGDAGINYYLNKSEWKNKKYLNELGYQVYCVRGNHEERPQNIAGMSYVYDDQVGGHVWWESEFPNIHYFADYGKYYILGRRFAVIGGAYSVDKFWRLESGNKWFPQEQLSVEEREHAEDILNKGEYDFVLTHTCPLSWQPTDLFLSFIDQSKVDNSMEVWLDEIKEKFTWKYWLFGHYHGNRIERPGVEMFFEYFDDIEEIEKRWRLYKMYGIDGLWGLRVSPFMKGVD